MFAIMLAIHNALAFIMQFINSRSARGTVNNSLQTVLSEINGPPLIHLGAQTRRIHRLLSRELSSRGLWDAEVFLRRRKGARVNFVHACTRCDISQLLRWLEAAGATLLTVSAPIYSNAAAAVLFGLPSCEMGPLLPRQPPLGLSALSARSRPPKHSRSMRVTLAPSPFFSFPVFLFLFALAVSLFGVLESR